MENKPIEPVIKFSVKTKFFLTLCLVSVLFSVPGYLYVRYKARDQAFSLHRAYAADRLQLLIPRIAESIHDKELLNTYLRGTLKDTESLHLILPTGEILWSSAPLNHVNPLSLKEVSAALTQKAGNAIRQEGRKETYLYTTSTLPYDKTTVVIRFGTVISSTVKIFQDIFLFYHMWFSLCLTTILTILLIFYFRLQRPLHQLVRFAKQNLLKEETTLPEQLVRRNDELGYLSYSTFRLVQIAQESAKQSSCEESIRQTLIQSMFIPLALLSTRQEIMECNAYFRTALDMDPLNESSRFRMLAQSPEFMDAHKEAVATIKAQTFSVRLPWLHQKITFQLCPLPYKEGKVYFALFIPSYQANQHKDPLPIHSILKEVYQVLAAALEQSKNGLKPFHIFEAQTLINQLDLLRNIEPTEPFHGSDLYHLFSEIELEAQEFFRHHQVELRLDKKPPKISIGNIQQRCQSILKFAIYLCSKETHLFEDDAKILKISFVVEETTVRVGFLGLVRPLNTHLFDLYLAPLGGFCTQMHNTVQNRSAQDKNPYMEHELWLHFRRA